MKNSIDNGRRRFVLAALTSSAAAALTNVSPLWAAPVGRHFKDQVLTGDIKNLNVSKAQLPIGSNMGSPITINGQMPGPLIRLKEGQRAHLNVTNHLNQDTSIHWHGIILPPDMDGVPGVSFAGIKPGETFKYAFDVEQNGTYWYHSHSGLQEQLGHLGPLVIDPADGDIGADREHTIILSDWTFSDPHDVMRKLKVAEGYYNYQKRTIFDTLEDVKKKGLADTWEERAMWGAMRMSPRDIADVTGSTYTYLMNGRTPQDNWQALFKVGEKIRLRIINGSAMTYFDFRIPGLEMTVVAADGQPVKPVNVDEFRIAVAETYDVIVQPKERKAYTFFAESFDRSGYIGDKSLMHIAKLMQNQLRYSDVVARYGGEEFIICLPHASMRQAVQIAEKLRKNIEDHPVNLDDGENLALTASFGVAEVHSVLAFYNAVKQADEALYSAKRNGRNRVATL